MFCAVLSFSSLFPKKLDAVDSFKFDILQQHCYPMIAHDGLHLNVFVFLATNLTR